MGNRRGKQDIWHNRDIVRELELGMFVAISSTAIPVVGEVSYLPADPSITCNINILVWKQEKAPHKPKWLRCFHRTSDQIEVALSAVVLYGFTLTAKGAFRKTTREYLQNMTEE